MSDCETFGKAYAGIIITSPIVGAIIFNYNAPKHQTLSRNIVNIFFGSSSGLLAGVASPIIIPYLIMSYFKYLIN